MDRKGLRNTIDKYFQINKKSFKKTESGENSFMAKKNASLKKYFQLNTLPLHNPVAQNNLEDLTLWRENLFLYFLQHNLYSIFCSPKTDDIKKMQQFMNMYFNKKQINDKKDKLTESGNNEKLSFKSEHDSLIIIDKKTTISSINDILTEVVSDYKLGKSPRFKVPKYKISFINGRWQVEDGYNYKQVVFSAKKSQIKFNCMLYLLHYIKCLLERNILSTKRECFYNVKSSLIKKGQNFTDGILNEIGLMLSVGLWDLNIKAQTGSVYGDLMLILPEEKKQWCGFDNDIPYNAMEILNIKSPASFILVVEKEAIFNNIIQENFQKNISKPFIVITGKGYPDRSTQLFIKRLWIDLKIPVLILVDADPNGIEIMMNYRFGSQASAYLSDYLAVPKAKWLGIRPSEISKYSNNRESLSDYDKKKIKDMLKLDCMKTEENIKNELEILLENDIKCEIESLLNVSLVSLIENNSIF
ncbi:meiotic W68 [Rhynchophorus ferrugineus]|uniref:meiotic W68 n=1 Tax=Rhynchophorus ferrugineus TaxID=354439 RepID=UPI003FCDCA09